MPHHYINSRNDESSYRGVHRRVSSLLKSSDEVNSICSSIFLMSGIGKGTSENLFYAYY